MWVFLALLIGCEDPEREQAILSLEGDVASGAELYAATCAGCHGADGTGGTGEDLVAEQPDAEDILEALLYGEDEMPSFDDLPDQDLADLVAFVLTL